jgi:glycosyltransferase involved in cell wall biosynthesis
MQHKNLDSPASAPSPGHPSLPATPLESMNRDRCSVTIITLNEERNLRDCLQSAAWADEIIVVDSGSSDQTLEIARQFQARTFTNPWPGMREQKNFAADQATSPWIFNLDADERITPEGQRELSQTLAAPTADAYKVPRQNFFLGKWMRHGGWFPDDTIRLYRKDKGTYGGINPHAGVVLREGTVGRLRTPLIHYTYDSFSHYISKQYPYSDAAARDLAARGKLPRHPYLRILTKTLWKFVEVFLIKRGFLDGTHGLVAAFGSTFAAYMKQARLWEIQAGARPSGEPQQRLTEKTRR